MNANPDSVFALASRTANKINSFHPDQTLVDGIIQQSDHPYWKAIEAIFNPQPASQETVTEIEQPKETPPFLLLPASPTFGNWLKMREELHKFLTDESVILRDMFTMNDEVLARTDIMPFFRPAGATNRMAVDWKKKLGIVVWEETDVMNYKNSKGPKIPELGFISRSVRPDADTLGKNAKYPNDIIKVKLQKLQAWLNLYGWCDADNLHFKILGEHLDSGETFCWFPEDRLPDGSVACGGWYAGRGEARLHWLRTVSCGPGFGARLAEFLPLKTQS